MTNFLASGSSWLAQHWWIGLIACALAIATACRWCLETDQARAQRAQRRRKKDLRALADRISTYGRRVHRHFPTGDVVVSVPDLAEQLRKRPDTVATALNLLLGEHRVRRAPLKGYWKLNV